MPPLGAWSGFGDEEEFPPLTLGSPFIVVTIPPSPSCLFDDLMASSDMDSSSPLGSEEMSVSLGEYQIFP